MLGYQKKESIYLKPAYLRGVFNLVCCVVGRLLFREARRCALTMGAEKLFISAIPSAETIAFYQNMGCTDANEIIESFVDSEDDRPLEITVQ